MDLLVPDRSYTANCIWWSAVDAVSTAVWRPPRIGSGTTTDGLYTLCTADQLLMSLNDTAYVSTPVCRDSQVYVSVPVSDVTTAIQRLVVCVSSINDWMSACQQTASESDEDRSASQQVSRINIGDIPRLSTTIKVAESTRDFGVILDAELTMSAHVTALCR